MTATVPALRRAISRLAAIANAAPWVAVAPCLLVVLGRDKGPTAVAALAVFFYVFVGATVGLSAAPRSAHDVLTALGARRTFRVRAVQLPGCWPALLDGLKLAAPAALAGAIFGEWYGAERGLGVLLIGAMQAGRPERLWAASLLCAACGLLAFLLCAGLRRVVVGRYGASIVHVDEVVRRDRHRVRGVAVEVLTAVGIGAVLVAAWYLWIEAADVSPLVVPRPSRVWDDLTTAPGDYVAAAGHTLLTAAIALVIGATVGVGGRVAGGRLALPGRRRRADHRRDGGDPARRHAAAVRPGPRLRAVDGARAGGGHGVLPRLRVHPLGPDRGRAPDGRRGRGDGHDPGPPLPPADDPGGRAAHDERRAASPPARPSSPPSSARA